MKLTRPISCDSCNGFRIALVSNHLQYGKVVGDWPLIYYCFNCKASVGCHAGTNIPLGKMADRETRRERRRAHKEFDRLWQEGLFRTRHGANEWLARELNISRSVCHIGLFDYNTCREVTAKARTYRKWRKKKRRDAHKYRRGKRIGK